MLMCFFPSNDGAYKSVHVSVLISKSKIDNTKCWSVSLTSHLFKTSLESLLTSSSCLIGVCVCACVHSPFFLYP